VLGEIGSLLAPHLQVDRSIWTANATGRSSKSPKEALGLPDVNYLTPRQAGSNLHDKMSSAAIIYSAKACANLRGLLNLLGIDTEKWTKRSCSSPRAPAFVIHRPTGDKVDLTARHHLHQSVEGWSLIPALRTTDPLIGERLDDDPPQTVSDTVTATSKAGRRPLMPVIPC